MKTGQTIDETGARAVAGLECTATFEAEALPHLDAVYRFALRLSGSQPGAEDLVQDTFLRAFRSWEQYTVGTRCRSWLFTICRNVFLRQRNRARRHDEIVEERSRQAADGAGGVFPIFGEARPPDPERHFFDGLIDGRVRGAIDALPTEFRTAVLLSDLEGLPYAEIAARMEVPVGTIKSRLFRGRRLLQKALWGYATEAGYARAPAAGP